MPSPSLNLFELKLLSLEIDRPYLHIDARDTIVVALQDLKAGTHISVEGQDFKLAVAVPSKHKFALKNFNKGDEITMYGVCVGKACEDIPKGTAITTTNMVHAVSDYTLSDTRKGWTPPDISRFRERTFNGYHRSDGRVGTENNWLVIPLVFCENRNLEVLEDALLKPLGYGITKEFTVDTSRLIGRYKAGDPLETLIKIPVITSREDERANRVFPNVDGIRFLRHDGGCGGSPEDSETLCRLLAGYITNPNVAGATVLSLGCQHAQIDMLKEALTANDPSFSKPVFFLDQQKSGTEQQLIDEAVKKTFEGLIMADKLERRPAPLSKLTLGLECGGSDGFSGISANPALGHASDMLVALGGATVLSEFPELNGVEQELIARCESKEVAAKFIKLMDRYAKAAAAVGSGFENNPSPGNIRDGLITDAMKSAGAAKKGGTSPVVDVLDYTEQVRRPGLTLLCTPGNDVESTTGLAGSGCNLIVFTTGLGTPTGNPVAPVIKVATNSRMARRMADIIDLDAGTIISGGQSVQEVGEALLDLIIGLASGERQCKARLKGQNDFIPWKRGISL
jgi:altronate hydrolase